MGGLSFLNFTIIVNDLSWIARSMFYPLVIWYTLHYFFIESRKSGIMPLATRFYRRITTLEAMNFDTHYNENIKASIKEL